MIVGAIPKAKANANRNLSIHTTLLPPRGWKPPNGDIRKPVVSGGDVSTGSIAHH